MNRPPTTTRSRTRPLLCTLILLLSPMTAGHLAAEEEKTRGDDHGDAVREIATNVRHRLRARVLAGRLARTREATALLASAGMEKHVERLVPEIATMEAQLRETRRALSKDHEHHGRHHGPAHPGMGEDKSHHRRGHAASQALEPGTPGARAWQRHLPHGNARMRWWRKMSAARIPGSGQQWRQHGPGKFRAFHGRHQNWRARHTASGSGPWGRAGHCPQCGNPCMKKHPGGYAAPQTRKDGAWEGASGWTGKNWRQKLESFREQREARDKNRKRQEGDRPSPLEKKRNFKKPPEDKASAPAQREADSGEASDARKPAQAPAEPDAGTSPAGTEAASAGPTPAPEIAARSEPPSTGAAPSTSTLPHTAPHP